jgi:hypothetical protein
VTPAGQYPRPTTLLPREELGIAIRLRYRSSREATADT